MSSRDVVIAASGSGAMQKWGYVATHAAVAAAFIFFLQRFAFSASLEASLLWALTFAACAAGLAYRQASR